VLAKRGAYTNEQWAGSSYAILQGLEGVGCKVTVEGMKQITSCKGPVVFVSNHMSTLETFVLPIIIEPVKHITFVVKPTLIDYPVFGPVMRSRNPIIVSRDNPRQDLITVLEEGAKRLAEGTSIVLFPQTTRKADFDPAHFNSLGVKLAKKAGVPVVPIALKTDAWGNGRWLKDYGRINVRKLVRFSFAPPVVINGNGKEEHEQMVAFIQNMVESWKAEDQ